MGMCVSSIDDAKSNKLVMPSPEKQNSAVAVHLPATGGDLPSQSSPRQPVAAVHDRDSKEERFFDPRPWLNSDSEDDFLSVNGDFTPSRGSTPVHPRLSRVTTLTKSLFDEKPLGFNSKQSPTEKKKSLVELFQESIRSNHADTDEQNVWSNRNEKVLKANEKTRKSAQCCILGMLTSRRLTERTKKMSSPPACSTG